MYKKGLLYRFQVINSGQIEGTNDSLHYKCPSCILLSNIIPNHNYAPAIILRHKLDINSEVE